MGLGALVGIDIFSGKFPFLASFLINSFILGAVYGIFWSILLVLRNKKKFKESLKKSFLWVDGSNKSSERG